MKENSRIRFNPVTKEIEIEGSESFVKTYFKKIQEMVFGSAEKTVAAKKEPKTTRTDPAKKTEKKGKAIKVSPAAKAKKEPKAAKKVPGEKRVTNIDTVIGLIQGSAEGISTSKLKEKTGLSELQIWSIVNRASKGGKIRKMRRGVYGPVQIQ
jgi:uncharacterized membrane protein